MLKLAFPTRLNDPECRGQVAYGTQKFDRQGEELVAQQWVGLFSRDTDRALTISNQTTYGFDHSDGELRLSLLRSPAYAGHPVDDKTPIVRQDRFTPRMDQGEHIFRFRIDAGPVIDRLAAVDLESRLLNTGSMSLCCFPAKRGKCPGSSVILSDQAIRLAAMKLSENGDHLILRLFETTGISRQTILMIPVLNLVIPVSFNGFEIKTLSVNPMTGEILEVDLMEVVRP